MFVRTVTFVTVILTELADMSLGAVCRRPRFHQQATHHPSHNVSTEKLFTIAFCHTKNSNKNPQNRKHGVIK